MKMLLDFDDWMSESAGSGLTQEQEDFLNECTQGSWKYDPSTGLVDVEGDFDCSAKILNTLSGVKFGKVSGTFRCDFNDLTSLEGSPREVGGDFDCSYNNLRSLYGSPQEVGGHFNCFHTQLTSLEGAAQEVGGDFVCSGNKLTTLQGAPQRVDGEFHCNAFQLGPEEWNIEGWLAVLEYGSPEAQSLILTILTPEVLNQEIQKDPGGMIMKLKVVWNDSDFQDIRKQLKFPAELGDVDKTIKSLRKLDDIRELI